MGSERVTYTYGSGAYTQYALRIRRLGKTYVRRCHRVHSVSVSVSFSGCHQQMLHTQAATGRNGATTGASRERGRAREGEREKMGMGER